MTTAARPTWNTAKGGTGKGEGLGGNVSKQYSSKDLKAHTKLKFRQEGQDSKLEVEGRDFKEDLETREREHFKRTLGQKDPKLALQQPDDQREKRQRLDDNPDRDDESNHGSDKEEHDDDKDDDDDQDDANNSDDDEDDEAELLRELQKIKQERAAEAARKEAERALAAERANKEAALKGNPLLMQKSGDFSVKRRWDDDVVFKNCAKNIDENKKKSFINDTSRSEFHRRFMEKYIQ